MRFKVGVINPPLYYRPLAATFIGAILTTGTHYLTDDYRATIPAKSYGIANIRLPEQTIVSYVMSGNQQWTLTNDFSLKSSTSDELQSEGSTIPVLPFYSSDDPLPTDDNAVVAMDPPIDAEPIDTIISDTTPASDYVSPNVPNISPLQTELAKGRRLVADTNDPRILAAIDRYNRALITLPTCGRLPNGRNYCVPMVKEGSPGHPRTLISKQMDFIYWLLELEAKENLPFGSLVVSGVIESKLGTYMGKYNGGYCNAYNYCGYFQFGPLAWTDFGRGSFKTGVRNNYKTAEATIRLKRSYSRSVGFDYRTASNLELYMTHQQGPEGARYIRNRVYKGYDLRHNQTIVNNIANNLTPAQRNKLVTKIGKSYYRLNAGYTLNNLADTWYMVWGRNTLGHEARVLPILLEMKGIPYHYQ